ncbi:MAG TPA: hypothetical protein PLL78_13000 [Fimbriimonadaceae bacterium]|nr:hypothetical protein [Fimbriimonadaceae bacterium]HRJ97594.1 hypothetical protein [Fimbriimonadaceae bacterium]
MNWDRLELEIDLVAPVKVVAWHWTSSAGLTRWLAVECTFVGLEGDTLAEAEAAETGARFRCLRAGGTIEEGELVQADKRGFAFGFADGSRIDLRLLSRKGRTALAFRHVTPGAAFEDYCDNLRSWTFYLTNLKSIVEGGLDLRELEPDRTGLVNV